MQTTPNDRRQHQRDIIVRPCKVRDAQSLRYIPAKTSDYSRGGALLCVGSEHNFKSGDTIEVGIAWANEAVLADERLTPARVKRVSLIDEHFQALGIEFDLVEQDLAHTLADAA